MNQRIDPKRLMEELSVEELCQTAEEFYHRISDPTFPMAKPFASPLSAPDLLVKMGLLLSGLQLGKSMVVLDFGAGSCWFSRFLNQMQCVTISVDPSTTALEMGTRLFAEYPIIGDYLQPPQFIPFDGHRINVPDESVDRIICFDAFHHLPNQEEVLREFYRVLRPGGIAGFSEPGPTHSQTPQSQSEMRNYTVLENDILLDEIKVIAESVGFSRLTLKLATNPYLDLDYDDYRRLTAKNSFPRFLRSNIPQKVANWLRFSMQTTTIFFLGKGEPVPDSRSSTGLAHQMSAPITESQVPSGQPLEVKLVIRNTGTARWLHHNVHDIGIVKVGGHLYDANHQLLDLDFYRQTLPADVEPGQQITVAIAPVFAQPGDYTLTLDLVSEQICWFELLGSMPISIRVHCR